MTDNLLAISASNLKKAIPLMMKYKVPITPPNYALWYTYVSNDVPQLNHELEMLLDNHDIFPPMHADSLYRKFVSDKNDATTWQLRQNLEAMLCEFGQSVKDTHSDSKIFQQEIEKALSEMHEVEDAGGTIEDVMKLIRGMEMHSKGIINTTQFLTKNLEKAQQEIESLKEKLTDTQKLALYDSLTGLLNRHSFDIELTELMIKENQGLCLIMADIDHFKTFNDEYGHLLGDQVLKAFGRCLEGCARDGSLAYRFGGEEFVILLPKSGVRRARQFAESMRKRIEKLTVRDKRTSNPVKKITASFGVSEFERGDTITSFITRADEQLYRAKQHGRNCVLPI